MANKESMVDNYATIQERRSEPTVARDLKARVARITFDPWERIFEPQFFRESTAAVVAQHCRDIVREAPEGTERRVSLWRFSHEFGGEFAAPFHVIGESSDDSCVVRIEEQP